MQTDNDYITLQNQRYRVEVNMAAAKRFEQESGITLSQFENKAATHATTGKGLSTTLIMFWMHAAIIEGAVLDGAPLKLTIDKLYQMARPYNVAEFTTVLIRHYMGNTTGAEAAPKTKKKQKNKTPKRWFRFLFKRFRQ